jgi:menaquinone-dependent protoporphyrinogen oxidase
MNEKVLVAYGTRYGSTAIIAREIADYLKGTGVSADLVNLKKDRVGGKLTDYRLVIAGSSVAMFSWVGAVKMFLRKCRKAGVPTVVFISAGTAIESPEKASERFLNKTVGRIGLKPLFSQSFAPVIDFRPGGVAPGTKKRISELVKTMAKESFQENGLMDLRNKEQFDRFLKKISDWLRG